MKKVIAILFFFVPITLLARVEPRVGEEPITAEPSITIVEDKDRTLQIHQINGKIYGMKVIPTKGKPYQLIDPDGEGHFVRSSSEKILVPEWVMIRW